MPELPEVETVRRSLLPVLEDTRVETAHFSEVAPFDKCEPDRVPEVLTGNRIETLERRGKYLLFPLESGHTYIVHLGMSGNLLYFSEPQAEDERPDHTHMRLALDPGGVLLGVDPRRFGRYSMAGPGELDDHPLMQTLGWEYDDSELDVDALEELAERHSGLTVKSFLLNQSCIAGIGNIYACEILFRARINPKTRMRRVSRERLQRLLDATREVLDEAIDKCGTSFSDYKDGFGNPGSFSDYLKVYGREGEPNPEGEGRVKKIEQQNRSTFYVPGYQT